ncbi:hypothetical protein [Nocardia camponoti]|nr:hypothetical protein [Nocardia camponoti]
MRDLTDPTYYTDAVNYPEQLMRADFARAYQLRLSLGSAPTDVHAGIRDQIAEIEQRWIRPDGAVFSDWQTLVELVTTGLPANPVADWVLPIDARSREQASELVALGRIEGAWR